MSERETFGLQWALEIISMRERERERERESVCVCLYVLVWGCASSMLFSPRSARRAAMVSMESGHAIEPRRERPRTGACGELSADPPTHPYRSNTFSVASSGVISCSASFWAAAASLAACSASDEGSGSRANANLETAADWPCSSDSVRFAVRTAMSERSCEGEGGQGKSEFVGNHEAANCAVPHPCRPALDSVRILTRQFASSLSSEEKRMRQDRARGGTRRTNGILSSRFRPKAITD